LNRLVLVGGGHGHLEVLRQFGARPATGVELVLVNPNRFTLYSGMLPGLVAGHYRLESVRVDLERLGAFARARFLQARATGVDPARRIVTLAGGTPLEFDIASIDIGSTPATSGVPGAADHAVGLKPIGDFLGAWERLFACAGEGALKRLLVVGGGAAGIEIALAMQHRIARETRRVVAFQLATDADRLLPMHDARVHAIFARILAERGVALHLATPIVRVAPGTASAADGSHLDADAIVWATGAAASPRLREAGLALDAAGFIAVNESLQSVSHPHVFAAGDCATMIGHPRPKSGVFAVRQGPPLAANLRAALEGRPLARYVPQEHALALISTGDRYAVASRGAWATEGRWVWRWKDWIDRRFVARYARP